jgi:hypothetical protein
MNRKTMTILILMLLVAAAGCQEVMAPPPTVVPIDISEIQERIRLMTVVQEELVLTRNILMLKVELAKFRTPRDPNSE